MTDKQQVEVLRHWLETMYNLWEKTLREKEVENERLKLLVVKIQKEIRMYESKH